MRHTDALRDHFETYEFKHIDPDYAKVGNYLRNYHFEQGILKLQMGQSISRLEKEAVQIFHLEGKPAEPAHLRKEFNCCPSWSGTTISRVNVQVQTF